MYVIEDREKIRKIVFTKLMNVLQNNEEGLIRFFKIPPLNVYTDDYIDLNNSENNQITEPLILSKNLSR